MTQLRGDTNRNHVTAGQSGGEGTQAARKQFSLETTLILKLEGMRQRRACLAADLCWESTRDAPAVLRVTQLMCGA